MIKRIGCCVAVLLTGCHRASTGAGPRVAVVDSLVLVEADTLPLGQFTSFTARDQAGRLYVSDLDHRQVQVFGPDGRLERTIGRPGSGPGEFEGPGALAVIRHDSVLVVADGMLIKLLSFSLPEGRYLGAAPLPAQFTGTAWTARGDTIVFATQQPGKGLIARWNWWTGAMETLTPVPPYEMANISGFIGHGRPDVVPTDSGYLLTLPTRSDLLGLDRAGVIVRSVRIPAVRRRGMSGAILAREDEARRAGKVLLAGSTADGLHRLPSGEWVVAHTDADFIGDTGHGRYGNFRLYLSLLTPGLDRACVDALVPIATDIPPIPVFRGDTMFVLARATTDAGGVRDVMYGFALSDAGCGWITTRAGDIAGGDQ